jgi:hypothetical protein
MNSQKEGGVKIENIIQSGTAIKSAVSTVLLMILLVFIGALVVCTSMELKTIKATYIIMGVILLFCNIRVLMKFYEAGEKLEQVKLEEQDENIIERENPATLSFVKYKTDKGVLEIPPCLNFKGQKAFLNGEPAPDGKYKYSFMSYFHIKGGVIIKG